MYGNNGNQGHALQDLLTQLRMTGQVPTQTSTAMTDLDEFVGNLPADERKKLEQSREFLTARMTYLDNFMMWQAVVSENGRTFASGVGRRLAQDLLETARRVHKNVEEQGMQEADSMKTKVAQQDETIAQLKQALQEMQQRLHTQSAPPQPNTQE